jgi:hypothetical protein
LRNFRDYLEDRERTLTEQLAERKRRVIPAEAELAEIRQAKDALGANASGAPGLLTMNGLRQYLEARELELQGFIHEAADSQEAVHNELAEIRKVKATVGMLHTNGSEIGSDAVGDPLWKTVPEAVGGIPYQSMTIGDLVIKALKEHFKNGAPIGAMVEFFRDKWGREIDRPSLSPQLSRLYRRDVVGRIRSTQGWFLIQPETRIQGQRPYLHQGSIVWMEPAQTTDQHEPLVTRAFEADIARDRMPYIRNGKPVWILPREADPSDRPALRHEFPAADGNDHDARLLEALKERTPEQQAQLDALVNAMKKP